MKAVILAGGAGTRLWPLSRRKSPKQLQNLVSSKSMLEDAIKRLNFLKKTDIFIATNKQYEKQVRKIAKGVPRNQIIIEPAMRDTGPCIGLAAELVKKMYGEDEVMAIIYADQYISNPKEFKKALKKAEQIAKKEATLNIVEVKAKFPNTGLGYVEIGKKLEASQGVEVYEFKRFKEKPALANAKKFIASKKFVWNTGIYVWQAKTILQKFKEHQPKTAKRLTKIAKSPKLLKKEYPLCDKTSIDYGIMEKVKKSEVKIVVADLGWNDIGTWESIHNELTQKPKDNFIKAKYLGLDTEGCVIYGGRKKLIATIGLKDLAIIDTDEALLICDKRQSAKIKQMLQIIKDEDDKLL